MGCTKDEVKLGDDGYWVKCINGEWMPLSIPPVTSGPGVGAFLTIESPEALGGDQIQAAIANPDVQVAVVLIDKPAPDTPVVPKPDPETPVADEPAADDPHGE
jgi:hypothetical protein